ncbi:MAG: phage tail protein [Burkholderiaceae bacterium]
MLAFAAIGAWAGGTLAAGTAFAAYGASIGWTVGAMVGQAVTAKDIHNEGPRIGDRTVQSSTLGTPMTTLYGTARIAGNVIHCSEIREVSKTERHGKGGPKTTSTTYSYNADLAIDLCAGPAAGIRKIFSDGKLIYDNSSGSSAATVIASSAWAAGFKFYGGSETQLPDPTLEALSGVGNVPAYRGRAYVVFTQLDCPGGRIPQLTFELVQVGSVGSALQQYSAVVLPQNFTGIFSSVTKDQSLIFNQYGASPDPYFPYLNVGLGYFSNAGQSPTAAPISDYPFGFVPVQSSGQTPEAVAIRTRSAGVFDLVSFTGDGSESVISGVPAPSGGGSPAIQYAAFDSVTSSYALAFSSPSRIEIYPNGPTISGTGTSAIHAFHNGLVYKTDTRLGVTYLDKYSATTGALLESIGSAQNLGNGMLLCASAAGVFALRVGVDLTVFKITSSGWQTLYLQTDTSFSSPQRTFYANENYAIIGASSVVAGATDFKLIHYSALTPAAPTVASIITDQCSRAGLPASKIDVSGLADTVTGYPITRVSSARANIEPLLKAFFIDPVEVDAKLRFVKRANQAQAATIAFDEFAATENGGEPGDPFALVRAQETELPRSITVQFLDVSSDYQPGAEQAVRQVSSSINDLSDDVAICTTSNHAKQVADVLLFDAWSARNKRSGKLTRRFAHLTPGDIVSVEYPRGSFQSRLLTRVSDSGALIEFDAVDANAELYQTAPAGSAPGIGQAVDALPAPSRLVLLDIPILRDADDNAGLYVAQAGLGTPWRGAALYLGADDASLLFRGDVDLSAPIGIAETALGDWASNTIDEKNTLVVSIGPDALSSSTRDKIVSGTDNACAIGKNGRWEILQFIRASALGGGRYQISGLKRGQRGTEANRGNHAAYDSFVLLTAAGLLRPLFDIAELGQNRKYRSVSKGLALDAVASSVGVNAGVGLKPLSPYKLRGARAAGDLTLTWSRRTRLSDNWLLGTVPLGETSESYSIDVFTDGAFTTVKRTLTSTTPTVTYTSAQQVADFGANQATVYLRIYQVSGAIGRGFYLQGTI